MPGRRRSCALPVGRCSSPFPPFGERTAEGLHSPDSSFPLHFERKREPSQGVLGVVVRTQSLLSLPVSCRARKEDWDCSFLGFSSKPSSQASRAWPPLLSPSQSAALSATCGVTRSGQNGVSSWHCVFAVTFILGEVRGGGKASSTLKRRRELGSDSSESWEQLSAASNYPPAPPPRHQERICATGTNVVDIAIACTRFRGCGVAEKGNPSVPDFRFLQEVGMIVLLSAMSVKGKKEKGFI